MTPNLHRRRLLLALLMGASLLAVSDGAKADDGEDDGGSSNSGSGSSGSGSSGSGSSNDDGDEDDDSGDDDNRTDDGNDDEDGDDGKEAQKAREAVADGKAVPMRLLLRHLRTNYPGKLLDVDLKRSWGHFEYRVKILQASGKVIHLRLDAITLQRRK
jgi:hypothetical protein